MPKDRENNRADIGIVICLTPEVYSIVLYFIPLVIEVSSICGKSTGINGNGQTKFPFTSIGNNNNR